MFGITLQVIIARTIYLNANIVYFNSNKSKTAISFIVFLLLIEAYHNY